MEPLSNMSNVPQVKQLECGFMPFCNCWCFVRNPFQSYTSAAHVNMLSRLCFPDLWPTYQEARWVHFQVSIENQSIKNLEYAYKTTRVV